MSDNSTYSQFISLKKYNTSAIAGVSLIGLRVIIFNVFIKSNETFNLINMTLLFILDNENLYKHFANHTEKGVVFMFVSITSHSRALSVY